MAGSELNLGSTYTLVDLIKMLAPGDASYLFCAETLARKNPIVREVPILEANQALTHIGMRQLTLPTISFRAINQGVAPTAHKEKQITEPMSLMEAMSQVDVEATRLGPGTPDQVRGRIDRAHMEGMAQKLASTIFYGSMGTDPLAFNGFATRFNATAVYPNGDSGWYPNVQTASGTTNYCTSAYVVDWGDNKVHLIYPKGTKAGMEINFLGEQLVTDSGGTNKFLAYVTDLKWRCGIYIADERNVQRVAGINASGDVNVFDYTLLIKAVNRIPDIGPLCRIYCNRTLSTQMEIWANQKSNMYFTNIPDATGIPVLRFKGIKVDVCDAIIDTEATPT